MECLPVGDVLVPLQVPGPAPDTDEVDQGITIEVLGHTARWRHVAGVQHLAGPAPAGGVRRRPQIEAPAVTAVTGDDLVTPIAVEVGRHDGVPAVDGPDDLPPPRPVPLSIDDHLGRPMG